VAGHPHRRAARHAGPLRVGGAGRQAQEKEVSL
jgi:hypothetical protein